MTASTETFTSSDTGWLSVIRRYIVYTAVGHLIWEMAHIPLYTIWVEGTWSEIAFAVVHCTGGDLLIAMSTLLLALFLVGGHAWPSERAGRVLLLAVVLGVSYTIFSEWLNIVIRAAWAYRDIMPVVPVIDAGLTPLLQWIIVPTLAYWAAAKVPLRKLFRGEREAW
ncbi:hypothetical protein MAA5396_03266 [Marinovum algicola]|uniref:Uncharacterized protein n=1 Tax=Marinovum algicola TaxID=42444 RepID=A0A975ZPD6_9RHOB|nr:hypothetical protein [Marinovum algicola]SEJ84302.1 hypothetical protein SAMN04487940_111144 [Marinovum algicola]SLN61639.1 hypothetical protein MAA5396_03266 [Marinovum algicola]